jgi:hypothetical protein
VVGTATVTVSVDIHAIRTVVIFGDPTDLDQLLQMVGRICVRYEVGGACGRAYVYLYPKAKERAEKALEEVKAKAAMSVNLANGENEQKMDSSLARMVLALCKIDEQNTSISSSFWSTFRFRRFGSGSELNASGDGGMFSSGGCGCLVAWLGTGCETGVFLKSRILIEYMDCRVSGGVNGVEAFGHFSFFGFGVGVL